MLMMKMILSHFSNVLLYIINNALFSLDNIYLVSHFNYSCRNFVSFHDPFVNLWPSAQSSECVGKECHTLIHENSLWLLVNGCICSVKCIRLLINIELSIKDEFSICKDSPEAFVNSTAKCFRLA